ncbi:MAG: glutaredoxin family protein [Terriglobia bacterium]
MSTQATGFKKQECNVVGLMLSWLGYGAGIIVLIYLRHWTGALLWLVLVPCLRWVLFRYFPSLSRFLGYGRVDDKLPAKFKRTHVVVAFYSFWSCPFCPIVMRRLEALQRKMDFTLKKIDVTFSPQLLMNKGILSVPVVEVGEKRLVGNVTSEQLAALIGFVQPAPQPGVV